MTYVFSSGVDNNRKLQACDEMGMRRVLVSYQYLRNKSNPRKFLEQYDNQWMIDSGAFTLNKRGCDPSVAQKYLEEYIEFLIEHRDLIWGAVGLDLDRAVGEEFSKKAEKEFDQVEALGVNVCHVWHADRGFKDWERMCVQHNWVGIPGGFFDAHFNDIGRMLSIAQRNLTRVHGFAITKSEVGHLPFYSVDSASWITGASYGHHLVFRLGEVKWLKPKESPKFYAHWKANGIAQELIEQGDYTALYRINLLAYREWETYLVGRHKPEVRESKPKKAAWWDGASDEQVVREAQRLWGGREDDELYTENPAEVLRWIGQAASYVVYMHYRKLAEDPEWEPYVETLYELSGSRIPSNPTAELNVNALRNLLLKFWSPAVQNIQMRSQEDIREVCYAPRTPSEMPQKRISSGVVLPKMKK